MVCASPIGPRGCSKARGCRLAQGGVAGSLTARLSQKGMAWPWGSRLTKGAWQGPNLPKRALRGFSSFDWPKGVWHGSGCSDCPKGARHTLVSIYWHQGAGCCAATGFKSTQGGMARPRGTRLSQGCGATSGVPLAQRGLVGPGGPDWPKGSGVALGCGAFPGVPIGQTCLGTVQIGPRGRAEAAVF